MKFLLHPVCLLHPVRLIDTTEYMHGSSIEAGFGHCVVKHREKFSWDPHVTDTCMGYLTRALAAREGAR